MSRIRRAALHLGSAVAAAGALPALLRRRRRRRADPRVFILEYHDVAAGDGEREGAVSTARFGRHLDHLRRHYRFATVAEAARRLGRPGGLAEDLVAVTFDDGYAGNFEAAWPLLRRRGIPATVFVATGFLDGEGLWFDLALRALAAAGRRGWALSTESSRALAEALGEPPRGGPERLVELLKRRPAEARERALEALCRSGLPLPPPARPLSWDQVRRMRDGGVEIGCHTVSHPILSSLSPAAQREEIRRARERIAVETGAEPTSFAFPNGGAGDFDGDTLEILREEGFLAACTTIRGSNRPGCDPLTLRRIGVGSDPIPVLEARLSGLFDGLRGRAA